MTKILIIEDNESIRGAIKVILSGEGHEILEAANGKSGVEKAQEEHPDLAVMDIWMPEMDGLEALRLMRENPATQELPVIMLTSVPPTQGEQEATHLGAIHYITKPFEYDILKAAIRSALKRASQVKKEPTIVTTGDRLRLLEKILEGGINRGSVTLVEGSTSTGKSALCQHLAYGALLDGMGVAYYASEHTAQSLGARMNSLGMGVDTYLKNNRLQVNTLKKFTPEKDSSELLTALPKEVSELPSRIKVVIVDAITNLVLCGQENAGLGFFYALKLMCSEGKTVILSADPFSFDANLLVRLHDLCDTHIVLTSIKMGDKALKNMEILKANTIGLTEDNSITYEVQKEVGIRVMPFGRAKA